MAIIEETSRDRIRRSALAELTKSGILGLRVADVAKGADCSVPLIYKYFGDRNGLLAVVLSTLVESYYVNDINAMSNFLVANPGPLDVAKLGAVLAQPNDKWRVERRWMRMQIFAASMEIPELHLRLQEVQTRATAEVIELIHEVRRRFGATSPVDERVLTHVIFSLMFGFIFYDLDNTPLNFDAYRDFMISFITNYLTK